MTKISKRLKETIEFLGPDYQMQQIDFEDCAYRDLGDYDIEISGCNNRKPKPLSIYVWSKRGHQTIIREIHQVKTLDALKQELDRIMDEYQMTGEIENTKNQRQP